MHSLRLKFALILIIATVAVVMIATFATWMMVSAGDASRMAPPMAHYIVAVSNLNDPRELGEPRRPPQPPRLSPRPTEEAGEPRRPPPQPVASASAARGTADVNLTKTLTGALADLGVDAEVFVTISGQSGKREASLKLADNTWMIFPFPDPPQAPRGFWVALGAWLAIFVAGIVAVALFLARRITQPFLMLENVAASVQPNGLLPHSPVTGSSEARRMAIALNQLADRVKSAIESRMRLVAAAGHDLRTPMTRMRIRAEFLADNEREDWISDLDELEAIADNAIRLVHEESTSESQVPISLDTILREMVTEISKAELPVSITSILPLTIEAGPLALKRALRNLIINAATHGGGARVKLTQEDTTACITIEDDGAGIPEALLEQVFEPFFRAAPGRIRTMKGAGLGLAIAKEIIERFGGHIEISNRAEGGLRQTVFLPILERPGT